MFCTSCGTQLPDDSRFCSACGRPVAHVAPPAGAPAPAAVAPMAHAAALRTAAGFRPRVAIPVAAPAAQGAAGYALRVSETDIPLVQRIMMKVHAWMAGGLLVTAAVAWLVANNEAMIRTLYGSGKWPFIGLFLVQLGLVFAISKVCEGASDALAAGLFLVYSALEGVLLSCLLLVYSTQTLSHAFVCAALSFAAMSAIGFATKRDLSGLGGWLLMALIGLLVAMTVNLIFDIEGLSSVISYVAVFVFLGLTIYDTRQIRGAAEALEKEKGPAAASAAVNSLAISGALSLYLDFINLFIHLVQIFDDDD